MDNPDRPERRHHWHRKLPPEPKWFSPREFMEGKYDPIFEAAAADPQRPSDLSPGWWAVQRKFTTLDPGEKRDDLLGDVAMGYQYRIKLAWDMLGIRQPLNGHQYFENALLTGLNVISKLRIQLHEKRQPISD